jgi:hypothetical protein
MKKNQQDKPLLKFSPPDPVTSRIFVSRVLPDNSLESIGIVFPHFSNEDGCVYYCSLDMNCDNIGSYTSDFNEVKKEFEKNVEKSIQEESNNNESDNEKSERGLELEQIRDRDDDKEQAHEMEIDR